MRWHVAFLDVPTAFCVEGARDSRDGRRSVGKRDGFEEGRERGILCGNHSSFVSWPAKTIAIGSDIWLDHFCCFFAIQASSWLSLLPQTNHISYYIIYIYSIQYLSLVPCPLTVQQLYIMIWVCACFSVTDCCVIQGCKAEKSHMGGTRDWIPSHPTSQAPPQEQPGGQRKRVDNIGCPCLQIMAKLFM